jgi:hypothetical protein
MAASEFAERIHQSQAYSVTGESVEVSQSAVQNLAAGSASLRQTIVQRMAAERADVDQSALLAARVQDLALRNSLSGVLVGQSVSVENARTVFLLSPNVSGPVTATFTLPAAFALGLGYVLGRSLIRLLAGRR